MESVTSKPAELSGDLFIPFASRRSVVYSTQGIIACTQPLAAQCGLKVLRAGGNAAVRTTLTINALLVMSTLYMRSEKYRKYGKRQLLT